MSQQIYFSVNLLGCTVCGVSAYINVNITLGIIREQKNTTNIYVVYCSFRHQYIYNIYPIFNFNMKIRSPQMPLPGPSPTLTD